jgi:hypothetical protein
MVVIRRFGVSDSESVHLEAQRGLRELDKPSLREGVRSTLGGYGASGGT